MDVKMYGNLTVLCVSEGDANDDEDRSSRKYRGHLFPATWPNMLELCSQYIIFIFWVQNACDQCLNVLKQDSK